MPYTPITYGDSAIYPELATAPTLPAAGGSFQDDTWGTRIYRVTDAGMGPGATLSSSSSDSQFNADGTKFYLNAGDTYPHVFGVTGTPPDGLTITDLGTVGTYLGNSVSMDGAAWDRTDPATFYAIILNAGYSLISVAVPSMTKTLLHNFADDIPSHAGYPSGRVMLHPTGQYVAALMSTFSGQDFYDYVVLWDKTNNVTVRVFSTVARLGAGVYLHAFQMDNSGEYVYLGLPNGNDYLWHWRDDTLSTLITNAAPDRLAGHSSPGWGVNVNDPSNSNSEPDLISRQLATPHIYTTLIQSLARKNGVKDWYDDGHFSRMLRPTSNNLAAPYYRGSTIGAGPASGWTWTLHSGSIYKVTDFVTGGLANQAPDTCWYAGIVVPTSTQIPTAPNQWWYDSGANIVYLWTSDGADLTQSANALKAAVFDWRPLMQELYTIEYVSGAWTWRRFAHTYSHAQTASDFYATTGPSVSPDGRYALFASRWGGASRIDAFLAVPSQPPSVAIVPNQTRRAGAYA